MNVPAPAILTVGPSRLVSVEAVAAEFKVPISEAMEGLERLNVRRIRFGRREYVGLVELHRAVVQALTGLEGQALSDYMAWSAEYYRHARTEAVLDSIRKGLRRLRRPRARGEPAPGAPEPGEPASGAPEPASASPAVQAG